MCKLTDRVSLCLALAFPAMAYALVALFGRPSYDTDYFEYIGWTISCGYELYRDIWDCKGPLLYYLYALGQFLFPSIHSSGTLLSFVLWEVVVVMVYRLARSFGANRHAGVSALLFVVLALGSGTWIWIGCQEIIATFLALSALFLINEERGEFAIRPTRPPIQGWRSFCLGACVAAAFMVKATCAAFGGAILVIWCLQAVRTGDWRRVFVQMCLSFLGFCVAFGSIAVMCSAWDWGRMFDASILYNVCDRGQEGVGWCSFWAARAREIYHGDVMWFLRFGWNYPFFLVLFILSFFLNAGERMPFFRIWLLLELFVSVCSKGFFDHYLIVSAVPLTMLFTGSSFRRPRVRTLFGFVVVMYFLTSFGRFMFYYVRYCVDERGNWSAVANLTCDIPEKTRVAVCGATNIHVLLRQWRLLNRNTYSAWMFWFSESSNRRRDKILDDFEQAVISPQNEWILSECPIESLRTFCDGRHNRLREELGKYRIVQTVEEPRVFFYKRIVDAQNP